MCKEDIRIKRKTAFRRVDPIQPGAVPQKMFSANPERVSLVIAWQQAVGNATNSYACLVADGERAFTPVGTITQDNGHCILTVEEVGQLVTAELHIFGSSDGDVFVHGTEVFFTEPLESL